MPAASDNRPTTFRSGVSSQPKYSVQHRSDILLTEQVIVLHVFVYLSVLKHVTHTKIYIERSMYTFQL